MISVEEALSRILAFFSVLEPEEKPILDALGQVVAGDIASGMDIPPYDNTAMDGYAVRAADTAGASAEAPVTLRVIGELAAGYLFDGSVEPGTAVRIMTGAPMPAGADAVVPFEETDEQAGRSFGSFAKSRDSVGILKAAAPGANVRHAAEDVRVGQVIIPRGLVLHPAQIGVLASLGRATVRVHRRPVVAILSTGDEVREPGAELRPGQIYDSNAYSIAALVTACGGVPKRLGIAKDTVEALTAKLREGLDADMLVTSAGVSRGDYDIVKDVLAKEGEIDFWTVRMRPGKPLAFGAFASGGRRVPHIGLPGNPVSSMVSFELFGRPAIFKMLGRSDWQRPSVRAIADEPIHNADERRVFARAIVTMRDGRYHAALTGPQGSGILTSMAVANALAVVPEDVPGIAAGEEVEALLLD
ncbi:MAG: molybdopterin molybdenumtransferase MoeA [Dehalococcoidia bacterium]|nr:MAG: molybdopterin molybdenumtransferase MoeA [Dehalococcoidia bacterium]